MTSYKSKAKYYAYNTLTDLYPIQFGMADCPAGYHVGPISYKNYLFHFVTSGKGYFTLPGIHTRTHVTSGQGFLIPPDHLAAYEADANLPWSYVWMEFNGLRAQKFIKQLNLSKQQFIYYTKSLANREQIMQPIQALLDMNQRSEAFVLAQLYLFFDALLQNAQTVIASEEHSHRNFRLRKALNFIEDNYQSAFSINQLADHVGIHPNHLHKLFKQELSVSPSEYLIHYRLNKACDLLLSDKENRLTMKEIAYQCGYANQYYFSTAFKKHFGQAPQYWKSAHLD